MSVKHRLSFPKDEYFGSSPKLVITVEGIDDVYRIARVLERAQVEFSEMGVSVMRGLDRKYPGIVMRLIAKMGPAWGYKGVLPRLWKRP